MNTEYEVALTIFHVEIDKKYFSQKYTYLII
jgi:hypothetical protein